MVLDIIVITAWISILFLVSSYILFRKILPKYRITVAQASLSDIFTTLNITINTEFDLWEKDIFVDQKGIGSNAQYENYYNDICMSILGSLSDAFFDTAEKYIKKDAIATIVARQTKNFLNKHVQESFNDPTTKILFDEDNPK